MSRVSDTKCHTLQNAASGCVAVSVADSATAESAPQAISPDPPVSNRGGPSSQEFGCGGVDTMDVSLWLAWDLATFGVVRNELQKSTEEARTPLGKKDIPTYETKDGDRFTVSATGGRAGEVFFAWQLRSEHGIVFQFQDREEATGDRPNGRVHFGAVPLINLGHRRCWEIALQLLEQFGARVRRNTLSRIDLALDIVGGEVGVYTRGLQDQRYLCRGQKWETFAEQKGERVTEDLGETVYYRRDKFTGFRIGRGACLQRFYDKTEELKSHPLKRAAMEAQRWGCSPEQAARSEFQLRREKLKDKRFNIDTVEDGFKSLPDLARYCWSEWYVQTVGRPDRKNKNQSRAKVAPCWRKLQEQAAATFGTDAASLPRKQKVCVSNEQLDAQALGLLASRIARSNDVERYDADSLIRHHLAEQFTPDQVQAVYQAAIEKRKQLIHQGYGPQLGEFNEPGPLKVE